MYRSHPHLGLCAWAGARAKLRCIAEYLWEDVIAEDHSAFAAPSGIPTDLSPCSVDDEHDEDFGEAMHADSSTLEPHNGEQHDVEEPVVVVYAQPVQSYATAVLNE